MRLRAIALAFVVPVMAGCQHQQSLGPASEPPAALPDDSSSAELVFGASAGPILLKNCALSGCHGEQNPQVGLRLTSWEDVVKGSEAGEVVVPFAPEQSLLLDMVTGRGQPRMPFNRPPLDAASIDTLRLWIAQGARNDSGTVPYSGSGYRVFIPNRGDDLVSVIDPVFATVGRVVAVGERGGSPAEPVAIVAGAELWFVSLQSAHRVMKITRGGNVEAGEVATALAPAGLALAAGKLYIGHEGTPDNPALAVTVVDTGSMRIVRTLRVPANPVALATTAAEELLFIASRDADWLSVVETQHDTVVREFPLATGGSAAGDPVFRPAALATDGQRVWLACRGTGQVRVLDAVDGRLLSVLALGPEPGQPALSPDGLTAYVPVGGTDRLAIIDGPTMQLRRLAAFFGLAAPTGCALSPDGRVIYVSNANSRGTYFPRRVPGARGNVVLLDATSERVLKVLELETSPGFIAVGR